MNGTQGLASFYVGSKFLKRVKLSWIGYGVIAYVGLRWMKSKGMLPRPVERAFDGVVGTAKEAVTSRFGAGVLGKHNTVGSAVAGTPLI